MSQSTVAKHMRVTRGAVGQWEMGATEPTRDNLIKLASLYRVDFEWIASGKGRPPGTPTTATHPGVSDAPLNRIMELDVRAGMGGGGILDHPTRQDGRFVDAVKDDLWVFPTSFTRDVLRAPTDRLVIIEAQGESMSPTIVAGERVIVDTGHKLPSPDGIYALRDRFDTVVVKRLQARRDAPKIRVISDNENHEDEEVDVDEIAILGRVVCVIKHV